MRTFTFRGTSFSFNSKHSGPAIIFLHGFLENQSMWDELTKKLPRAYRKICLDLPGHGASDNLGYVHSMEDMAEVVKALADHLKLKRFFLCGHSLGGYVALAFAEKYPDMIKGLLLLNSTARADSDERKRNRDRAIETVKRQHKSYIRIAVPMLFRAKNRRNLREAVNEVKAQALTTSKQGVIAALEGMKIRPDREVLLHFAPYNVLFVGAKHDPIIPQEHIEEQMKAHRVEPLLLENGHMSHMEDFEPLLEGVKGFLKKH
jgi:pimeloyl-ACP methyl ester carboxylesterase